MITKPAGQLLCAILLMFGLIVTSVQPAVADNDEYVTRTWVARALAYALIDIRADKHDEGRRKLDALLGNSRDASGLTEIAEESLTEYETAQIFNIYAFSYYKEKNLAAALEYYDQVIDRTNIPVTMYKSTLFTTAQLSFALGHWEMGIEKLNRWITIQPDANAVAHILLAKAYYQVNEYLLAAANYETALSVTEGQGKVVKKEWYEFGERLYGRMGENSKRQQLADERVMIYPTSGAGILPIEKPKIIPTVKVAPVKPSRARNIKGYCTLGYSVSPEGKTYDIKVIDCQPAGYFEKGSIRALKSYEFKQYPANYDEVVRTGLTETFTYH